MEILQEQDIQIELTTTTPGAQIRYTLNEEEPTIDSYLYSTAVQVPYNTILKAKTFKDGYLPGETTWYSTKPVDISVELWGDKGDENLNRILYVDYINNYYFIYTDSYIYTTQTFEDLNSWKQHSNLIPSSYRNTVSRILFKDGLFYCTSVNNSANIPVLFTFTLENIENDTAATRYSLPYSQAAKTSSLTYSEYYISDILFTDKRLLYINITHWKSSSSSYEGKYSIGLYELNINSNNISTILSDVIINTGASSDRFNYNIFGKKNPLQYNNGVFYFNFLISGYSDPEHKLLLWSKDLENWNTTDIFNTPWDSGHGEIASSKVIFINGNFYVLNEIGGTNSCTIYYFDNNDNSFKLLKTLSISSTGISTACPIGYNLFAMTSSSVGEGYYSINLKDFSPISLGLDDLGKIYEEVVYIPHLNKCLFMLRDWNIRKYYWINMN